MSSVAFSLPFLPLPLPPPAPPLQWFTWLRRISIEGGVRGGIECSEQIGVERWPEYILISLRPTEEESPDLFTWATQTAGIGLSRSRPTASEAARIMGAQGLRGSGFQGLRRCLPASTGALPVSEVHRRAGPWGWGRRFAAPRGLWCVGIPFTLGEYFRGPRPFGESQ